MLIQYSFIEDEAQPAQTSYHAGQQCTM